MPSEHQCQTGPSFSAKSIRALPEFVALARMLAKRPGIAIELWRHKHRAKQLEWAERQALAELEGPKLADVLLSIERQKRVVDLLLAAATQRAGVFAIQLAALRDAAREAVDRCHRRR